MVKTLLRRQIALLIAGSVALSIIASSIMPALASANYSPSILSDSPFSYWRLGEAAGATTAADVKGRNALTYSTSGVTLGQPGAILGDSNTAATFNGSTGDATAAVAGTTATTNWSVEAWINPSNLNQAGTMVYNGVSGSNGYGFGISSATSLTTAGSELTGIVNGALADSGYGFPSPNTWYHVVMTRDTSTIRWYVNGLPTSKTSSTAPGTPGARFSLGAGINASSQIVRPYAGGIDEAAVYTVQLSAGRIDAHFQDGAVAISGIGQWASLSPTTVPAGRYDAASAYDASASDGTHGKLVVFGGENSSSAALQETWTWDGSNWNKLTPATSPSARWGARMAYDSATGLIYLFGGYTGTTYLNDTWKWDGTTWTKLSPTTSPSIRLDVAMAYDAATSTVVLFGGSKGNTYNAETWSWNGTNWSSLAPSPAPGLRANAGMAYDAAHSKIVLFGGYSGSTYLADTWLWSGTAWSSQSPPAAPSARTAAAMAYNPITGTTMLFGGLNGTSYYADSWSWDGSKWGLENSTSNPGARAAAVLAWDATTGNIVLFDGRNSTAPLTDTWNRNTPPGVATGVSGLAGNTQVTVSWTAALSGGSAITQYLVTASPGGATKTVTSSPAPVTGLTAGTAYTFTVVATNSLGTGAPSAASVAVTPYTTPGAPTAVTATAGNALANVTWTAPASNGGLAISTYTITSSPGGLTNTVNAPATSGPVNGLTNGTPYTFTVYATNAPLNNGPASSPSNSVTPSTTPGAPTNVVATAGDTLASLTWTAAPNGGATITSYTATASPGGATATVNGNPAAASVSYTAGQLTDGTAYTFTVVAYNVNGNGPSSAPSNSVTPSVLPGAPTNVVASASNQQATVTWTAPANAGTPISSYTITSSPGNLTKTVTGNPPATSGTVIGLTNGTTYTFQVTATNTGGTGPAGTSNAVTPSLTPQAPTNVGAAPGNHQVTVTWTAPDPGGSAITGYVITPCTGVPCTGGSAGSPVNAGAGATSVSITDFITGTALTNGTPYTFKVYATNSYGNGFVATSPSATPTGPATAPTNIVAVPGNGQATVSWGAPTDNGGSAITSYTVTPLINGTPGTPVNVAGSVYSTPVSPLTNGTTYVFKVYATNGAGSGTAGYSLAITVGAPTAPGSFSATAGANKVSLTWTASSPNASAITGYTATAYIGGTAGISIALGPSATTATLSGLKGGTGYTIQMVATNSFGTSPTAISASVTPSGSAATYASTVQADGAAAYYRTSDTGAAAADSSGNGGAGAYQGTYTHGATGLIGSDLADAATSFDGSSGYASAPTQSALQGDHARTVELWFNAASSATQVLFDSGGTGTNGQAFYIGTIGDGGICGAPSNSAGAYVGLWNDDVYIPGLHLNDGATHHLVVTLQGASLWVYADGATASGYVYNGSWSALTAQPFTLPTTPNTTGNQIWIGHGRTQISCAVSTYFTGIIDEVAIYPTALSAAQVTNHFQLAGDGAPGAPGSPSAVAGTNQATVSWSASPANGAPITSYLITAYVSGITPQNAMSVGGGATSAVITGLPSGGLYNFQIQARNGFGSSSAATSSGYVTIGGTASTYSSTVIGNGPIAYYRLGDTGSTAMDSSGYANSAAIKAGVTEGAGGALPGDADTAFAFSGGSVQDQSFTTLPSGTSARTYEAWVKTISSGDQVLFSYGQPNGGCSYTANGLALTAGNQVNFITRWNSDCYGSWSSLAITAPYSIANGAWHQLAATWDGTTVVMYLDGQSIGSQAYSTSLGSADGNGLVLGNLYGGRYLAGSLDEVSIYPSALSAAQVLNHFQASGNSRPAAPTGITTLGGANQVTVGWNTVTGNPSPLTGYLVTAMQGAVAKNALSTSPASTSVTMTGLQGGTAYTFQVQAANNFGVGLAGASAAVTPSGSATTYASTVEGDSPVYYYRLDDASAMAADSSGNGRLAYVSGGYTQGAPGALANDTDAAMMSTSRAAVQFAQGTGLPSGTSARTYEAWVKTTSTGDQVLFSYGQSASGCGYPANGLAVTSGNQVNFITRWNSDCYGSWSTLALTAPYSIANGAWHQLAATWDGSTVTAYLDGQAIGSQAYSTSSGSVDSNGLVLGSLYGGRYLAGSLDEVSIYPSALNATQVFNHFQASGNSKPVAPTGITTLGGPNKVTVSWNAVSNPSPLTGYLVTAMQGATAKNALSTSATSTSVTMTGLQGGTSYTFQVQAANNFGLGLAGVSAAVTPSGSATTYASTVQSDSPAYYYRLDDASAMVADSSGNGRLAYAGGGYTQGATGVLANDSDAATIFTSTGAVQFAQGTGLPGGTSARTYEAWVKTTSTQDQALFSYGQSAGGCGLPANGLLLTAGNQVNFITRWNTDCYSSVTSLAFAAPSIANGAWHQVAATWDGATVTMYLDGQPIGSQAYTTSQGSVDANGLVLGSLYGGRHLVGSLDEVSIYPSALSATQIFNHFKASGNGVPTAPTAVSATSGQNSAVVSWTPPAPSNGAITGYTVAAITDGTTQATTTTDGSAQSANVPALLGGQVYTFTVAAQNAIGTGPASAPSAALTINASGNGPSPIAAGFGQYLYIWNTSNSPFGPGTLAIQSENTIPALASWTVEGWLNLGNGMSTYGTSSSWGVLSGQGGGAIAGINWDQYNNARFVWPGSGSYAFSPCGSCGWLQFVIQYDGTNVTGYVGGNQVFQQASASAQVPAGQYAGYSDGDQRRTIGLDEFRVSSVARYTGSSFQVPNSPFSGTLANTTLLWHLDEQGIRKMWNPTIAPSQQFPKTFNGEFPDASGNGHGVQFYSMGGGYGYASPSVYQIYALGAGQTAASLDAGGSPWVCPCTLNHTDWPVNSATGEFWHTFDDISVPGRGFGLDFTRSYSSAVALATPTGQEGQLGYGWSGSYNAHLTINGSVITVYAGNGSAVTFTQANNVFSAQAGVLASLAQSGGTYTLTQEGGTQLNFDSLGRLTAQVDRNGYSTTLAYNGSGQITTVTEPSQGNSSPRQLTFTYNASGFIAGVSDASLRSVSFRYEDGNGNLTSAIDLNGNSWTFAYDTQHELTTMKSPLCVATQNCLGIRNAYTNGRVTSQTDAMGRVTTFAYSNGTTTITDPKGNIMLDEYQNNVLMSETTAYGTPVQATSTYQYDPSTLSLLQVVDPNGNAGSTVRDPQARVLKRTDARGSSTLFTYNSFGEPLTTTDPLGTATTNTYDSAGNLTQSSTPLVGTGQTQTSLYAYQDSSHPGDITQLTDADGKIWLYASDQYGNRVTVTDPLGNITTFQYDLAGRMTSKVMPRGNVNGGTPTAYTWTSTYDGAGDQLTATDPLTHVATLKQYDGDRNLIQVADPNGHWTNYTVDLNDETTKMTRFDGSTQQTVYDADGNILKQTDGRNQTTVFAYDQQNRQISVTDPLNRVTTYSHDGVGALTSMTDANGHKTTYAYDSGNELTSVSYQLAQPADVQYGYDLDGRRISMTDGTGTSTYHFDSLGRITQSVNGAGAAVGYGYDLMARVTSISYPGGVGSVTRTYYDNGSLRTVSDWLGHTTTYSYDADSNLVGATYPNGITETASADAAERVGSIVYSQGTSQILSFTYSRDLAGQLTGDGGNTYSYSSINQVTGGTLGGYQYDAADHLTQMTPTGGSINNLTYDNAGQLATATTTAGGIQLGQVTYAFDANGNRISQTSQNGQQTVLGWDQANHLTTYGTSTYTYDGNGLRATKTVAGSREAFAWDIAQGLPLVIQDGGTSYVSGPGGLPLEQITGTSVIYYHEDQLGSVRGITDATGTLACAYSYDPYGNLIASTGNTTNPFRFAGQYMDSESSLYYLRARYYDPAAGQFVAVDPAVQLTQQPFSYVSDNPLNGIDNNGLDWWPTWGNVKDVLTTARDKAVDWVSQHGGALKPFAKAVGHVFTFINYYGTLSDCVTRFSDIKDTNAAIVGASICMIDHTTLTDIVVGLATVGAAGLCAPGIVLAVVCGGAGLIVSAFVCSYVADRMDDFTHNLMTRGYGKKP